ncbi:hypothetical protein HPP92_017666 [Vanilla planifolia]|uniref:ABC transporter domain-containing protein n=1 Tax=Vanilla planifolia TaxID=51239 RepID=A0A835UNT3_VANPL|nr:hypothetical protein HPP92_017666 [Vanilla planifolia]
MENLSCSKLRTSVLSSNMEGEKKHEQLIDVTKLGAPETRSLVDKLIKNIEKDNLRLLQMQRERMERVDVELPTIEVQYKNLCVDAECEIVQGKPLPTLWNAVKSMISNIQRTFFMKPEAKVSILRGVRGTIKSSRMTLLLGPPGSGKTTLMQALAGKLGKSKKVFGEISYNGFKLEEFIPEKTSAYVSQHDVHIPEMTVREILDFSARFQASGIRGELLKEVIRREKEQGITPEPDIDTFMKATVVHGLEKSLQIDYILKITGMDRCANVVVGNNIKRGISGGEMKRLTIGEMLVGPAKDTVQKQQASMPIWLSWGFWSSPSTYAQIGLVVTEFQGARWQKVLQTTANRTIGELVLTSRGLNYEDYFYWISVGALLGFFVLLNVAFALSLTFRRSLQESRVIISREKLPKIHNEQPVSSRSEEKRGSRMMALPSVPIPITFQDVQYFIDTPKEMVAQGYPEKKLKLLCDINGAFHPGKLSAIMGVTGAGKTTLSDVISGRVTGGTIEGEIRIGGNLKDFVTEVLETVELDGNKDSLVGLPGINGLSTEQRKRLTIAVELVSNPSIILMDEPTSGLDARAAAIVMRTVKKVAETGRTVACTIHQPSIDIFETFDEKIPGIPKIMDNYNPATWVMEVTSTSLEAQLSIDFKGIYKESDLHSLWKQFRACLWKQHLSYWRTPSYNLARISFVTMLSSILAALFWQHGRNIKYPSGGVGCII